MEKLGKLINELYEEFKRLQPNTTPLDFKEFLDGFVLGMVTFGESVEKAKEAK